MLNSAHGVVYQEPVGRGYDADDLQKEQLRRLGDELAAVLPSLLDEGLGVYLNQIKQEQAMKALSQKLAESLAPEHRKSTHDMFRARAEAVLREVAKAEAESAKPAEVKTEAPKKR